MQNKQKQVMNAIIELVQTFSKVGKYDTNKVELALAINNTAVNSYDKVVNSAICTYNQKRCN